MTKDVAQILQITSYPPPRAGWGVRVEFLKRALESQGHTCRVLNIGRSRTIPSPEYETVMGLADFVRKVWRFSRAGFTVHVHVNGQSEKGFVLTLLAEIINWLWGKRCVLTFHAGVDQKYFPKERARLLFPMYWLMFAIPRTIICNSETVRQKIVEFSVSPAKIVAIPAFSRQYLEYVDADLSEPLDRFLRSHNETIFTYIRVRPGFYLDVMIDGFALLAVKRPAVGLVICGVSGDIDPALHADLMTRISAHQLSDRVLIVDDLDHDQFLTALKRSSLYLRTPTSDGVASSVLESLALGVPVVGAENGTRPPGVVTYRSTEPAHMAQMLEDTLDRRSEISASLPKPELHDTVSTEVRVLTDHP
jgi:glycosyltransferase involved in cell wall biosynthesis